MSKDDFEKGGSLLPVHIEISKGEASPPQKNIYINVETFEKCFINIATPKSPSKKEENCYSIYAVISKTSPSGMVNLYEPPVSRTFIGWLEKEVVKDMLPNTWKALNQ